MTRFTGPAGAELNTDLTYALLMGPTEGDDEAFDEDGAQDISLSINEDVVEIVIPRNGEEEKTLTALGQAIQSLGS